MSLQKNFPQINSIIQGDSLEVLKTWPDEFVDLVITSPPYYALRNYGVDGQLGLEKTFEEYQEKLLAIIAEIKRVLKPMGQFWLNMGDIYASNGSNETRFWHGSNPGKHKLSNDTYAGRARMENYQSKCLLMMPERIALKMIEDGWILRNKIKWAKQILIKKENTTKGSVMPTSVKDRFNESGEEFYFFVKNKNYYSNLDAVRMPAQTVENRPTGIDREKEYPEAKRNKFAFNYRVRDAEKKSGQPQFRASEIEIKNYQGKFAGSLNAEMFNSPRARTQRKSAKYEEFFKKKERGENTRESGLEINATWDKSGDLYNPLGKNLPTVWLIQSEPHNFRNELEVDLDHFAIFPQALVEIPIKFGSPEKGIICDPFIGSGTVALMARNFGRNYIGIELNPAYIKLAEKRLSQQMLL